MIIININNRIIHKNAKNLFLKTKNIIDQSKFIISCEKYILFVFSSTFEYIIIVAYEIPIKKYKIVQTIGKTIPGGESTDLFKVS